VIRNGATAADVAGDPRVEQLLREAVEAMRRAYAPYSRFRVGAALLASDGRVFTGCNVENASYPAGICAERGALMAAVAAGAREFSAIAVATEADAPTPPCGMCRQMLVEFAPMLPIESVTRSGLRQRWTLGELLPSAFTPAALHERP
jgi:cytidine deaminase